jgi:hypothetical protein
MTACPVARCAASCQFAFVMAPRSAHKDTQVALPRRHCQPVWRAPERLALLGARLTIVTRGDGRRALEVKGAVRLLGALARAGKGLSDDEAREFAQFLRGGAA